MKQIGYFQWTQRKIIPHSVVVPDQSSEDGGTSLGSIMLMAILFILIAVIILREPLKAAVLAYVQGEAAAKQAAEKAAQEAAAYAALERDVTGILDTTDQQFEILSDSLKKIASDFETNLGIPLHLAHEDSTPEIDDAILMSQSFKRTFKQFLDARIPSASIENKRQNLGSVKRHLHYGNLTDIDRSILQTDFDWICSKQNLIESQQNRLQQILSWIQDKSYAVNFTSTKGD